MGMMMFSLFTTRGEDNTNKDAYDEWIDNKALANMN